MSRLRVGTSRLLSGEGLVLGRTDFEKAVRIKLSGKIFPAVSVATASQEFGLFAGHLCARLSRNHFAVRAELRDGAYAYSFTRLSGASTSSMCLRTVLIHSW